MCFLQDGRVFKGYQGSCDVFEFCHQGAREAAYGCPHIQHFFIAM